ncbi:MAG TPA: hypothetical protein VIB39_18840 [Candidatus Angelobacter sp.]|jgi:Spy/CpxP family protein refolding chaperone
MKHALVRLLTLVTLAASVSAFAATDNSKSTGATAAGKQQNGCTDTQEGKKQKKDKKQQDESQQEKDFDRLLMGTHG